MLQSSLKCLLNLPEIEQRSSDWSTLIVNYKKIYYTLTIFLRVLLSFITKENAL
jgi:hypothetical protein